LVVGGGARKTLGRGFSKGGGNGSDLNYGMLNPNGP